MLYRAIKSVIILGLLLSFVSCVSISTLNLDVLRPAMVTVEPEIVSVLVMDNSLPFRGDNVHKIITPKGSYLIDTIWIDNFGEIAGTSMADALRSKFFFDSVYYHNSTKLYSFDSGYLSEEMLNKRIDSFCDAYDVDAIISLEKYDYETELSFVDFTDFYYGSLDVSGGIYWKIYGRGGKILDMYVQNDSIFWDDHKNNYSSILKSLPSQSEGIEVLADYLGETYINRITPYWETVQRKYYMGGHHLFLRANDLHQANNWEDAAKVWYYVYEHGNSKQKARAAFNIALSYEVRGDFDEAIAWGDLSQQLFEKLGGLKASQYDKGLSKLYYIQLSERYQQKKRLDAQIGY